MPDKHSNQASQPYAVIGAGDLVSHVHRDANESNGLAYRFNLFRLTHSSEVTHSLRPADLRDVVKACQVLAFAIADDGWLPNSLGLELHDLANELDAITQNWRNNE